MPTAPFRGHDLALRQKHAHAKAAWACHPAIEPSRNTYDCPPANQAGSAQIPWPTSRISHFRSSGPAPKAAISPTFLPMNARASGAR